MSTRDDDRRLRERFQTLKREDRASTPDFSPQPHSRGVWVLNYRLAAVALVIVLLAGFAVTRLRYHGAPGEVSIAQISNWHSPTDSLLQTPGNELLQNVPRFGGNLPASEVP